MLNLGEKKVHFKTKDGLNSSITFQVTKVKKPLAAVSKITEKGNWVCFGPSEAYIENVATGLTLSSTTALAAWTWSTSMSQVLRGWSPGSNGAIKRGIKEVQGQLRAMKKERPGREVRSGHQGPLEHPPVDG